MLTAAPELAGIDLNLLVVLDALLAERNVTRAARRLGLTQPSTSHALSRLRDLLGDPLLVRVGRAMHTTPRADALAPALARTLADVRRLLQVEPAFDPATSQRAFTIACPDLLAPQVPAIVARMQREAPRCGLELRPPIAGDDATVLGAGGVDLALAPAPREGTGLVQRALGTVSWGVLARRGHPALRRRTITREAWLAYPHVVVRTGSASPSAVGVAIERLGLERRVGLVVPGFLLVPRVVASTDMLAAVPRELVVDVAREMDLVVTDVPIPIGAIPVAALWHERFHADEGHRWMRGVVVQELTRALRP
ncbi:LysR family transcriptional regulator [Sandaracinus amylolyticus]|uniref:LysR family transcriptional regulator n=1 Tax=Sandaracinus amylolyticus TaxID=927083 RepID=UPI001F235EDC|nr:LysR family transcriptional regulator [Sandaracinus amylolyticus]UJR79952.1 HTH-type transcriptional regulator LeuO [Sandaracinus amylolyticus]